MLLNIWRKVRGAVIMVLCLSNVVYAYSGGSGDVNHPYIIATVNDWNSLMTNSADWNKYFVMGDDIDLKSLSITPVGNSSVYFTGVFDGNGFVISNATINLAGTNYVGLFGYVGNAGRIKNLGAGDVNITGYSNVGGLAGRNYGGIARCYTTGTVYANATYCGGITGRNDDGNFINCYSKCSINGTNFVGGFVGSNNTSHSDVNKCYSTGLVTGSGTYVGGLGGYNGGGVEDSFWDVNTSGKSTSAGGTGKTTAQMQDINTYLAANWDFNTPIWKICSGTNYPRFAWQGLAGDFACPEGVGPEDLAFFAQRWLNTNCVSPNNCDGADLNQDGKVNFLDFAIFADNWMEQ